MSPHTNNLSLQTIKANIALPSMLSLNISIIHILAPG